MADQHSIRDNQSEKDTGMNEDRLLSDDTDIFDQLQQEFDTLVSGEAVDASPPAFSDNSDESFGELPTPDEQTDVPASAQEQEEKEAAPDPGPKPDAPSPNESSPSESSIQQGAADKTPPLIEHPAVAASPDKSEPVVADKISDSHPRPAKKETDTPVSTIMMLGLAVAILMAAVAGSIWAFYSPSSQQAASNKQSAKDTPQVIITKPTRAVKYIPIDKSGSSASKQSPAHTAEHAALAANQHAPGQAGANHKKTTHTDSAPARSGDWIINLESFNASDDANAYATRLTQRDIHADVMAIQIKGKAWYRVRLTGFPSKREAEKQRLILVKKLSLNSAWISKSRH